MYNFVKELDNVNEEDLGASIKKNLQEMISVGIYLLVLFVTVYSFGYIIPVMWIRRLKFHRAPLQNSIDPQDFVVEFGVCFL